MKAKSKFLKLASYLTAFAAALGSGGGAGMSGRDKGTSASADIGGVAAGGVVGRATTLGNGYGYAQPYRSGNSANHSSGYGFGYGYGYGRQDNGGDRYQTASNEWLGN
jgi:hypothetical protein